MGKAIVLATIAAFYNVSKEDVQNVIIGSDLFSGIYSLSVTAEE